MPNKILLVIIVANIKKFRVSFYNKLANELLHENIELKVLYSDVSFIESSKNDSCDLSSSFAIKIPRIYLFSDRILFQKVPLNLLWRADFIITVQSNGYFINYVLYILRLLRLKNIAFWGHGYNHQGNPKSLKELFKKYFATKVDWWFTYTNSTGKYLHTLGFPQDRITVLENAVDTTVFKKEVLAIDEFQLGAVKRSLDLPSDAFVAIFCGSLYADKKIDFIVEAGSILHQRYPNFYLIMLGDGPLSGYLHECQNKYSWIRYLGGQFGSKKALYFALSNIFLNPGLVGLSILDSFAAGLPFLTTNYSRHSPEIEFLNHQENGLILPLDIKGFVTGIETLMRDEDKLNHLSKGAIASSNRYTLENMVSNTKRGILEWTSNKNLI